MTGPTRPLRRPPAPRPAAAPPRRGAPPRPDRRPSRWLGVTGLLAGGLAVLALALVASWMVAPRLGLPGPAADLLAWHLAAAVAVVVAQVRADRSGRPGAVLAVDGAALVVLGLLWFG